MRENRRAENSLPETQPLSKDSDKVFAKKIRCIREKYAAAISTGGKVLHFTQTE
jgi:hypothetical protein